MKKALAVLLALMLACLMLAGCGAKFNSLEKIQQNGKIVYYTDAVWAPFEYIGAGGQPEGVDVDIARRIAEEIGVELEIVNASFDGFALALKNNQADIAIAAITITPERAEEVDFSMPYIDARQYIVVPAADTTTETLDDLAGKRIGVHLGTTGDFLVTDEIAEGVLTDTGATVVQYKSLQEGCLAMLAGHLDAIVVDTLLAENLVAVNPGLKCFEAGYDAGPLEEEFLGVAVAKGNDTLLEVVNKVLEEMLASGEIEASLLYHTENASLVQ
ncbi:transporter substrate-binding domain-containing protein [Ruminococcaceae bacterium OttesenSCG-928-O06]|nr:transporter substrate-binding domain-containing protein [Ruminococcaceae bacterium OttesenSCG-928-O06]